MIMVYKPWAIALTARARCDDADGPFTLRSRSILSQSDAGRKSALALWEILLRMGKSMGNSVGDVIFDELLGIYI